MSYSSPQFVDDDPESTIDYWTWISRILGWDGLLPLLVSTVPVALAAVFPNNQQLAALFLVCIPIIAFMFRFLIGVRQIRANCCNLMTKRFQIVAPGVAIFLMLFIDFFLVLSAFIQNKNREPPAGYIQAFAIALAFYVSLVSFAMYPGRRTMSVTLQE